MYARYETYERIRKEKGLRDSDVCKRTGISSGTMSDWKKGRYTPKADKLQSIATALGVSFEMLTTGREKDSPAPSTPDIDEIIARAVQETVEREVEKRYRESSSGKKYYFDDEAAEIAQYLYENEGQRILFEASRGSRPEDLKMAADLLARLKETNKDG